MRLCYRTTTDDVSLGMCAFWLWDFSLPPTWVAPVRDLQIFRGPRAGISPPRTPPAAGADGAERETVATEGVTNGTKEKINNLNEENKTIINILWGNWRSAFFGVLIWVSYRSLMTCRLFGERQLTERSVLPSSLQIATENLNKNKMITNW